MGGNNFINRKYYTNEELDILIDKWRKNGILLQSPFTEKIYDTEKRWRIELARYLDSNSKLRFLYKIDYGVQCKHCENKLNYESYSKYGFRVYCPNCEKLKIHLKRTKEQQKRISKKISKILSYKFKYDPKFQELKRKIGENNSIQLKKYFKTVKGKRQIEINKISQSKRMRKLIKEGKFTPCITNSFTHWNAKIILHGVEYKFRSSWEACFWLSNNTIAYENLRISYNTEDNKKKIYIADFFDNENNILYEIKPRSFFTKQTHKINQIINYCIKNNIKFIWINEFNILNYVNKIDFEGTNMMQYEKMLRGINNSKYEKNKHN